MSAATLHYIFDPLCGWCYGAAPLLEIARAVPGLAVEFHGGGMMVGANRRQVSPEWRQFVLPHDRRIAEVSGQPFGAAYFDGLLKDHGAVMDSAPPTTAMLAAEELAGQGLALLHRIQRAHFVEGRRIADTEVLTELAADIGLDAAAFAAAFHRLEGAATNAHFQDSRRLLAQVGGQGFPTLALEENGQLTVLDLGAYLGRPDAWRARLSQALPTAAATTTEALVCGPDSCVLPQ
ncbi:protein-disulfide isomerase [Chromobacterium sp. LK1]|uniref:DsbA family protein n=1 Tax=Chromobacterium sp. LK1 TaxID=1628193 RepID=UPI000653EB7C|nr:DsbA family protein [Chromobacterium sp. LK1]KMN35667.1 protein-disulfide isomerase [Chromobacterium sp. LK1]